MVRTAPLPIGETVGIPNYLGTVLFLGHMNVSVFLLACVGVGGVVLLVCCSCCVSQY